jgi:hypothetical protein
MAFKYGAGADDGRDYPLICAGGSIRHGEGHTIYAWPMTSGWPVIAFWRPPGQD